MAASENGPRRTRIPDRCDKSLSLWGIMRHLVGKEMTKISLPVNFSEPLSFLQRLTEDLNYSELLDRAAKLDDGQQIAYVAAFAVSSYSTTIERTTKPFNPLLGETFECDRMDDLGWRCISEQVSHHPPISAMHCEGKEWNLWQEFSMTSKFRGKFIRVVPCGITHLTFKRNNNHYTWNKVSSTVHNIIIGNLWIDQTGTMTIKNHTTGWVAIIEFVPYNQFNHSEQRSVKGIIQDEKEVKLLFSGTWDSQVQISTVTNIEGTKEKPIYKTGETTVLWQRRPLDADSKNYYNFTVLACQLNEPESGVAPTDSRNRPDQRAMEEGNWDEANQLKLALEASQRERNRKETTHTALWFTIQKDSLSGLKIHVYNGKYWESKKKQKWTKCPDIYTIITE